MNKAFNIYSIYHVGRFEIFLYVSISWSQPPILVFEILQMYLAASQDRFANICNLVNIVNIVNNVRIVIIVIIVIIVNIVNIVNIFNIFNIFRTFNTVTITSKFLEALLKPCLGLSD